MRPEFDPRFNGAWDKLDRYHREAAITAALRQDTDVREPIVNAWLSAWTRRIRQVLHLRPLPAHQS